MSLEEENWDPDRYIERRQCEDRQKGKYHVATEAETEMARQYSKEQQGVLAATELERRPGEISPPALRESVVPATSWFLTSDLQN